ncbi:MAG: bifunctional glutamate N-acetyltransferase/amino-acid acetyltransferase ArgJ [bacterium]
MKVRRESRPVAGFAAGGIHAGIKREAPDLAMIVASEPVSAAALFTRSTVVGAPVEVSREHVRGGRIRGVVVNSGCSNVAMGARGVRDARAMARLAARAVGSSEQEILVASTGVIGEPLPLATIRAGIPRLMANLSPDGWLSAAEAIRTTDTHAKVASTRFRCADAQVTITGIAKGSGMIEPDMATMLSFVTTDAAIAPALLQRMLKRVADRTYNCLSVDGEGSTSDTVVLMASGASGGAPLRSGSPEAECFESALGAVCEDLVRQLARDGEGATRLLVVSVEGARSGAQADRAARRIANSMLVKTAVFGGDPNWGRILQTLGAGRIDWSPETTRVRVGGVVVFSRGRSAGPKARERAEEALRRDEVAIEVELGCGGGAARIFSCDLSDEYIRINADYTT